MNKNYNDVNAKEMHASIPCPGCKNDNADKLIWDNPDDINGWVLCLVCGIRYSPSNPSWGIRRPS